MRAELRVQFASRLLPPVDPWCEFRVVAGMDEVVRDSRVLRIGAIERLKQIDRLFLLRMRLVGRRCIREECERVKHLGFDVLLVG